MKTLNINKSILLFLVFLLLFLFCENQYEWSNPLDADSTVLPESWAPTNLQLQKISDTQIRLIWEQDEKRIEGFRIERKVDNGSWQELIQLGENERSYMDSGLDTSKLYSYKICAFISGNQSLFSNEVLFSSKTDINVVDIDGNLYKAIRIDNQWWMIANLKVTRYRNGDAISNVTDNTQWPNLTSGAYCNYDNITSNAEKYGRLYNWYAVNDSRGLAPAGWRVPTDADWQKLIDYLGGNSLAGSKLKEAGTIHWNSPNTGATNESGFTALPGGYRYNFNGFFYHLGSNGYWWSSTEHSSTLAWYRSLSYNHSDVYRYEYNKLYGFSVRCVRD